MDKSNILKCLFCLFLLTHSLVFGEEKKEEKEKKDGKDEKEDFPLKIGNFSLRTSQQPGPLVGVGENIIDKGETQVFLFADISAGNKNYRSDAIPSILFGITDDLSVFFNFPFSPGNKQRKKHSSGWEDVYIQLEYSYFQKQEIDNTDQATILANISYPTGSPNKNPPTGFGSPAFTVGTTYNHMTFDWFYFGALQGIFPSLHHRTRFGNQYLYELGIGGTIDTPPGWIYAWMVEFNGVYAERNLVKGKIDRNSGGNMIFITPSIWISSDTFLLQFGIGPVFEQLYGNQPKQYYSLDLNLGYSY